MISAYACNYVLLTFIIFYNRGLSCQGVKGVKLLEVLPGHQMDIWNLQIAGVSTVAVV